MFVDIVNFAMNLRVSSNAARNDIGEVLCREKIANIFVEAKSATDVAEAVFDEVLESGLIVVALVVDKENAFNEATNFI